MQRPQTRYARSGDLSIAYQVLGEGPLDVVVVFGWVSHLDDVWEVRAQSKFMSRIASYARLVMFDKRGTGMSDPVDGVPTLEERIDDMRAVMDEVGSDRAALFGISEGGPMSMLYAATYPDRVSHLVLSGSAAKWLRSDDYPIGPRPQFVADFELTLDHWGEGLTADMFVPEIAGDPEAKAAVGRWESRGATPTMARRLFEATLEIDVRDILPTVRVPTLVHHREGDRVVPVEGSRFMADRIPQAELFLQPGTVHFPWFGGGRELSDRVQEFLTGTAPIGDIDRALATVVFTDIVDSTEVAASVGDSRWSAMLDRHDEVTATAVTEYDGRLVRHTGDGALATFTRPAAAVRCAAAIRDRVRADTGLEIRAGAHTGEIELRGSELGGIAVHIGARIADLAAPGEVVVSRTVRDLVVGSGLGFAEHGTHDLRGVPEPWQVYRVEAIPAPSRS